MNWENYFNDGEEQPLDRMVQGYSCTSVFRTMAFIGDSLSSGEFETFNQYGTRQYHDMYEYSFGQYIARKNAITAYNFSRGGMTAKQYVESYAEDNGWWGKEKACQAYVIVLGVNDIYNPGFEMGTITDVNTDDYRQNKPTFLGYYATIISRYKGISPHAKFFLVTFPNDPQHSKEKAQSMVQALYDLATLFDKTYVINLYKYGPVYDEAFRNRFFLNNHMSPAGYLFTAEMIDSYIDYIIRHNSDHFKATGFIGTDIWYRESP